MLKYATFTDKGGRPVNEDSIGAFQKGDNSCFILCDGLGGHGMGDEASALVVGVFESMFNNSDDMVNFVGQSFVAGQQILMQEQIDKHAKHRMKTTGVAVVTDDTNAYIGHVGDSRAYVFKKNKVKCRTIDHSVPQMLALSHDIKESEIRNHPDRSLLLKVIGVEWEEPQYELMAPIPLKKCQAFLLCSDGFWELIEEKEMCSLLKGSNTVEEWLQSMVEVVKANGVGKNMDNFSAIAVWVE